MIHPPRKPLAPALLATLLAVSAGCETGNLLFGETGGASAGAGGSLAGSGGAGGEYASYEGTAFPNRRTPIAVPAGGLGIVANSASDRLALIDLSAGGRTGVLPVGRDPITVDGPADVVVDRNGGHVYVLLTYPQPPSAANGPHAAHAQYDAPGYVQKLLLSDLRIVGEVRTDLQPHDLAISDDGSRLVALHHFEDQLENALIDPDHLDWYRGRLALIDPAAVHPILSDEPERVRPCLVPRSVVLSRPDGAFAYVACYGEDAIALVGLAAIPPSIERIAVAPDAGPAGAPAHGPTAIALAPDGSAVAFANELSRDVGFLDLASKSITATSTPASSGRPVALAYSPDGAWLYVATREPAALLRFDAEVGAELANRVFVGDECPSPNAVAITPDGSCAMVCSGNGLSPGKVLVLDPSTLATRSVTETGLGPTAIAIVPGESP